MSSLGKPYTGSSTFPSIKMKGRGFAATGKSAQADKALLRATPPGCVAGGEVADLEHAAKSNGKSRIENEAEKTCCLDTRPS